MRLQARLMPELLQGLLQSFFDVIGIGTGPKVHQQLAYIVHAFTQTGIQLDYMATRFAVSTYNLLLAEGRKTAAALIAVDDAG